MKTHAQTNGRVRSNTLVIEHETRAFRCFLSKHVRLRMAERAITRCEISKLLHKTAYLLPALIAQSHKVRKVGILEPRHFLLIFAPLPQGGVCVTVYTDGMTWPRDIPIVLPDNRLSRPTQRIRFGTMSRSSTYDRPLSRPLLSIDQLATLHIRSALRAGHEPAK